MSAALFQPTPALISTLPCPPDECGIRWRSRISDLLVERASASGRGELAVLSDFIRAVAVSPALAARIEAGIVAPSPEYRARAAEVLGVAEGDVFEAHPAPVEPSPTAPSAPVIITPTETTPPPGDDARAAAIGVS